MLKAEKVKQGYVEPEHSVIAPEETRRLRGNTYPEEHMLSPRTTIAMPEDQAIWRSRLRPRTRIEGQTSWREREAST